jgi:carbon monoxide dehydrogenase subunit G
MSRVHVKIKIDAPVDRVWETIMDPHRLGEWVTIHRQVKNVSGRLDTGSTMDQVLHMRGVSFNVHWTLADCDRPNLAVWEGQGPARSTARIRYELSGDGDGPTEFDYTNEFNPPGGRLGSLASRVVVGAASEREARNSLRQLKALLEGN